MPLSVADLQDRPIPLKLPLYAGDLNVTWYPGRLTGRVLRDLMALDNVSAMRDDEGMQVLEQAASLVCTLIHSWDMVESFKADGSPGEMVALTPDRLSLLGLPVLWAILIQLVQQSRVGEANGTTSPAPSRATSRTARRAGSRRLVASSRTGLPTSN